MKQFMWVLLGVMIGIGGCLYGKPLIEHAMFYVGYIKISGIKIDGPPPPIKMAHFLVEDHGEAP